MLLKETGFSCFFRSGVPSYFEHKEIRQTFDKPEDGTPLLSNELPVQAGVVEFTAPTRIPAANLPD